MKQKLVAAIRDRPLLFEPVPPSIRSPPSKVNGYIDSVSKVLRESRRVDAFVIPELVNENHNGEPHYRSGNVIDFASQLSSASKCEAILNKVVAHLHSKKELRDWCHQVFSKKINHVMLIGGTSRYIPYPGPSVVEANRIALPIVRGKGLLGNVVIPHRQHEGYRMLSKTRSGASFFTTQIVFSPNSIVELLYEYSRLCGAYEVIPSTVIISVAPVADEDDLDFVRWLGADIPFNMESDLLSNDGSASIESTITTWFNILKEMMKRDIHVPLGVNVEVLSPRHFSLAVNLLHRVEEIIDEN